MNDWKSLIQRRIANGTVGVEIGPFCNPLAPKKEGYQTVVVDIKSREDLHLGARVKGESDQRIAAIEDVDVVGDASDLACLLRSHGRTGPFNWIISSHNFEHLRNPLRFLQDCEGLLGENGLLMMVIPDHRFTFDRFHPHTITADVIRASAVPHDPAADAWDCFRGASQKCQLQLGEGPRRLCWSEALHSDQALVMPQSLARQYLVLQEQLASDQFSFAGHRWHLTPAVLELLLFDLAHLQLIGLRASKIHSTRNCDFLAIIEKRPAEPLSEAAASARRHALCCLIENERAAISSLAQEQARRLAAQERELQELRSRLAPGDA
ncbi:MAG: hypothetical protein FGM40_01300 [Rhodocyclaceae bacterium]|nr:hypothetical protein [Rhodocyclaceae bacterium]